MRTAVLVAAAALACLSTVSASCANKCSGHGTCGKNDACTCYANWQGSDCSQRTCPFGRAWVDTATGADVAHNYAECSNRGICDRSVGQCECSDGYTGAACARTTCPEDCGGHGTCQYIEELATSHAAYDGWDTGKTRGCKCDAGYAGVGCTSRMCPRGDDPLTTEVDVTQAKTTSLQVNEVQNVTVQSVNNIPINSGNVTFTFTDLYNGVWTTRPVLLPAAKAYVNNNELFSGTDNGGGATSCRLATASAGGSGTDDYLNGASVVFTTGADVSSHVITDYAQANKVMTTSTITSFSQSTTTYSVRAGLKSFASNWRPLYTNAAGTATEAYIATFGTVASEGMYTHTMAAKIENGAINSYALRKGDWIMVGDPLDLEATSCLMEVAEDYAGGTSKTLKTVADDTTTPCNGLTTNKDTSGIYVMWTTLIANSASYSGASSKATKYDSATGTLTITGGDGAGNMYKKVLPGQWIRLFHNANPDKGYCDMQLNHFGAFAANADVGSLSVNAATATATTEGGSNLCSSWTTLNADIGTLGHIGTSDIGIAHLNDAYAVGQADALNAANTKTTAIASSAGVATITTETNFNANDVAALPPGVLLYVMRAGGNGDPTFFCACVISTSPANSAATLQCKSPPKLSGASVTDCSTQSFSAVADYRLKAFPGNGIYYDSEVSADSSNAYKFQHLQAGDTVRVSNPDQTSDGTKKSSQSATFEINTVDPATLTNGIFFKVGSKPNGGGMYPMLGVSGLGLVAADNTHFYIGAAAQAIWLKSTTVIQPAYAAKAWSSTTSTGTWTTTDAACTDSAKDVKRVLEELPNRVVESVDVSMTSNTVQMYAYSITFTGAGNTGNQNEIVMNSAGCLKDGCQPRYSGVAVQSSFALKDVAVAVGAVTSATTADLTAMGVSAAGGETLLVYQAGAMNGLSTPNTYTTSTQITTDGVSTASGAQASSVMVLKNKGSFDPATQKAYFKSETFEITRGTKESSECAGRGKCDGESGLCECFEGYTGESCSTMTVLQ